MGSPDGPRSLEQLEETLLADHPGHDAHHHGSVRETELPSDLRAAFTGDELRIESGEIATVPEVHCLPIDRGDPVRPGSVLFTLVQLQVAESRREPLEGEDREPASRTILLGRIEPV